MWESVGRCATQRQCRPITLREGGRSGEREGAQEGWSTRGREEEGGMGGGGRRRTGGRIGADANHI